MTIRSINKNQHRCLTITKNYLIKKQKTKKVNWILFSVMCKTCFFK